MHDAHRLRKERAHDLHVAKMSPDWVGRADCCTGLQFRDIIIQRSVGSDWFPCISPLELAGEE